MAILLVKGVAMFYQNVMLKLIGQHIATSIQLDLYSHLLKSDLKLFHRYPSGNLLSRFTNDINILRNCFTNLLSTSIGDIVTMLGLIGLMFYNSVNLTIASLIVFPLAFKPIIALGKRMREIAKTIQKELGSFTMRLDESFQNIKIIKSYCKENYEILRAHQIVKRVLALYKKSAYIESAPSPLMETIGGLAIAVVIWYGGYQVIHSSTTPGAFFSFITALLMLYKPMKSVSQMSISIQEIISVTKRIFKILEQKPEIEIDDTKPKVEFKNYNIEFSNVSFAYHNTMQGVLDKMSLKIPQGKTVALVGVSGGGKTTILNLLERLYDPTEGQITIGGHDISKIKNSCVRQNIALVSQEIALFDDTISENIRYGNLEANEAKIIKAAKAAAAHEFIIELNNEYQTNIGQKGLKLSGGQKQRLAIARAILKNAPILLLDEATSSLDCISERQVQDALENLKRGRTTIVIAHRLSTIENADIIYLISKGKVLEEGTHKELVKQDNEYAKFYRQYRSSHKIF